MVNDYLLRMFEDLGKSIGKGISNSKQDAETVIIEVASDKNMLKAILKKMLHDNKINEAENLLFKFAEEYKSEEVLEAGKWFYQKLCEKSEEELQKYEFTKKEVELGMKDFVDIYKKEEE